MMKKIFLFIVFAFASTVFLNAQSIFTKSYLDSGGAGKILLSASNSVYLCGGNTFSVFIKTDISGNKIWANGMMDGPCQGTAIWDMVENGSNILIAG